MKIAETELEMRKLQIEENTYMENHGSEKLSVASGYYLSGQGIFVEGIAAKPPHTQASNIAREKHRATFLYAYKLRFKDLAGAWS